MHKYCFFDFDNTLVPKDSMGRLIPFCLKKHPWTFIYLFPIIPYGILYGLKLIDFIPLKQKILFPLAILREEELKEFYETCLIPNYFTNVVEELKKKKEEGYIIYLVSASPEMYLKYTDLPVDQIIGTKAGIENGKVKIYGKNCKSAQKVVRIQEYIDLSDIDYENSYGYSDSSSDLPMLKLCKHMIHILKKDGTMTTF